MNESVSNRPGKRRVFFVITAAIVVLLVLIVVFCTCTDTGRMIRKVGIPYQVTWSYEPEGYGYTLYICQTKEDMVACALKKLFSTKDGATIASVDRGEELQIMHSYAENGTPKTELLYLFLVEDRSFEQEGVKEYDYKGLTHYTFQLVDNKLVILCITETDKYNSGELRQIGLDAYDGLN